MKLNLCIDRNMIVFYFLFSYHKKNLILPSEFSQLTEKKYYFTHSRNCK